MVEQTFILIKPEHINLAEKILEELDKHGSRIQTTKIEHVPQCIIERHYQPHRNRSFFYYMTGSFIDQSVIIAVYEGEDVIQKVKDIIGPTDPSKAPEDTIRGKYGTDSLEKSIAEQRALENVIHRSESCEEARREINVWKEYLEDRVL